MLYAGSIPNWDTSKVRPAGTRLKTFGGRASGPGPLIELFQFAVDTFKEAAGRKLNSVECHDICCKIGEIVICGGVRRCLPGGTPVFTVNGPKAISEIVVGDEVVSGGKRGKVVSAGYSGKKKTIIIKHRFGEIECTPEHRVAVFNSIMEYEFKEAKDIVIGDRLVWDTVGYDGHETALPELEKDELHFNAKLPTIPALTTEVAWFFGLFHGDGCVSPTSLEIAGNTREMETLKRASAICKAAFNLDSSVGNDGRSGAGARMRVSSTVLSKWFHSHIKQAKVPIRIPRFIFEAKREIRFAYLAGLLDADGRIRKDGRIDQTCTVYQQFAEEVVTLLAGLGIGAVTFPGSAKKRRDRGENAQDFWNISIVGNTNRKMFYDGCKKFSLKIASKILGFSSPIDFSFPIRWGGSFLGYKPNGNISVMSMRYNLPLLPTRVISIREGREVKTYDIQVEGIERFTANGLVVHNSAIISLSNPSDDRMRYAKSGEWWKANPHRALANISACYTEKPGMDVFMREWLALYDSKSGERGIFNREAAKKNCAKYGRRDPNHDFGSNPCNEVILRSASFCNLTEVVARPGDAEETLKRKVRLATIMGTMQATITNFSYLRKIWRQNTEEEALLGVSITGVLDNALLSGAEGKKKLGETLGRLREYAVSVNKEWAAKLGINQATATTCIKPSGTVSLLAGCSSGIHPRHSQYFIRTIRADKKDPLAKLMVEMGFPHEDDVTKPEYNWVFSFPMQSPEGSVLRDDLTAIDHLELWKTYQDHWTEHKPSITVNIRESEWMDVGAWVYRHFDSVSGIAFLPFSGHSYRQAPYSEVTKEEYEKAIAAMPKNVDWSRLGQFEIEDNTQMEKTLACNGDSCEMSDLSK